jgi:RimJ/RimL family protein N-acetyltransferase
MVQFAKFSDSDYERLISWVDSAEALMQFAGPAFTFPLSKEQLDMSLNDPSRIAFKISDKANEVIGHAEIYLTADSAYLGRILIGDPHKRGKGLGKEIVSFLVDYAFNTLNQSKVQLNVFDWNMAAIKCYEKAGFRINRDKQVERNVNDQTWIALNMSIDKHVR